MTACDRVFVYGTLRAGSGHPMAERLRKEGTHLGPTTWRGRLYSLGPYPAAVRHAGHLLVQGDLYQIDPESDLLAALDAYEGYDPGAPRADWYVREVDQVVHPEQGPIAAWVYRYTGPVSPRTWISHGDWLTWCATQPPPAE